MEVNWLLTDFCSVLDLLSYPSIMSFISMFAIVFSQRDVT